MALVLNNLGPVETYDWGYRVRFELVDLDTGRLYNGDREWKTQPTDQQVQEAVAASIDSFEQMLHPPAPPVEYVVTCEDNAVVEV